MVSSWSELLLPNWAGLESGRERHSKKTIPSCKSPKSSCTHALCCSPTHDLGWS